MYKTRFIKQEQASELINLYHLSRSFGKHSTWEKMVWASEQFSKIHSEVSSTGAYKDLDGLLQ